jgi:hypothetical protein
MSLNWNVEEIPLEVRTIVAEESSTTHGYKAGDRIMNPVTHGLIFATVGVGIGVIDDNTADEFAARLTFWQQLNGALLHGADGPVLITKEDVEAHKGLSTNVFPMERRAAWIKRTVANSDAFYGVTEPKREACRR